MKAQIIELKLKPRCTGLYDEEVAALKIMRDSLNRINIEIISKLRDKYPVEMTRVRDAVIAMAEVHERIGEDMQQKLNALIRETRHKIEETGSAAKQIPPHST